jgi:hypothetical protein
MSSGEITVAGIDRSTCAVCGSHWPVAIAHAMRNRISVLGTDALTL